MCSAPFHWSWLWCEILDNISNTTRTLLISLLWLWPQMSLSV